MNGISAFAASPASMLVLTTTTVVMGAVALSTVVRTARAALRRVQVQASLALIHGITARSSDQA